jgi:DNA-binding beta-propeller fold protein YncE
MEDLMTKSCRLIRSVAMWSFALTVEFACLPAQAQVLVGNNVGPSEAPQPISIIDADPASPTFNMITATVDNNELRSPGTMAFSPDGAYAYLAENASRIEVVNLGFNSVSGFIDPGFGTTEALFLDVGPDGTGYAVAYGAGNPHVAVINMLDGSVIGTIPLQGSPPPAPSSIAVRPDGGVVYVLLDWLSSVARIEVINTITGETLAVIPVARGARGFSFRPDGAYAYVRSGCDANVQVIDTLVNQTVGEVTDTRCANDIAFRPDGEDAYITFYNPPVSFGGLRVIDTRSLTVVQTIDLPGNPVGTYGITASSQGYVYVEAINQDFSPSVFVIYTLTNSVVGTVTGFTGYPGVIKGM